MMGNEKVLPLIHACATAYQRLNELRNGGFSKDRNEIRRLHDEITNTSNELMAQINGSNAALFDEGFIYEMGGMRFHVKRETQHVEADDPEATLEHIQKKMPDMARSLIKTTIVVSEHLNYDALRQLPPAALAEIGARIVPETLVYIEPVKDGE